MVAAGTKPLVGLHCLVLRPEGQAAELAAVLRDLGAAVTHCPTTEIQPVTPPPEQLAAVESADWLVFISPNAVRLGLRAIAEEGLRIPDGTRLAAVGAGTAHALREAGSPVAAQPARGGGGEALLAHPDMATVDGRRVVIVRGEGGRETLANELTARGARVTYLEVYRRTPARLPDAPDLLHGWQCSAARVTIVTSVSGWQNLLSLTGPAEREALMAGGLVGVSHRVVEAALAEGHRGPAAIAEDPSPTALAAAVEAAYRRITESDT